MIGKGIKLSTGFDLNSQSPLDNREVFETIEERDALPNINLYEGLTCYVKETKENYQYIDGNWTIKNRAAETSVRVRIYVWEGQALCSKGGQGAERPGD